MWHSSAAPALGVNLAESTLRRMALAAIDGVGDAELGQWEEMGRAFHVRRRLTAEEAEMVGEVVDIRGTPEARRRLRSVSHLLPAGWSA